MIRSFADRDTERLARRERVRSFVNIERVALRKLAMLDAAAVLDDLRVPPGNRLEALRGDRAGYYSIRVNDQYRICFRWEAGDAYDVELTDYH
ncbi:MAG: plasmid maintenance system killer [Rhodobacteraceae bacterium]|nr:plasmid maintenance system killer [Paracoccaceae bacterium]